MWKISAGTGGKYSSSTSLVLHNSDLLEKIFLCLPVKFLLVLKHVSKQWYALISDSYFTQKHRLLHYNNLSVSGLFFRCFAPTNEQHIPIYGMLLLDKEKFSSTHVSFVIQVNDRPVGLYIEQSCNGILLCFRPSDYETGTRYIYNPSTRHYRMISPPPPFQTENMTLGPSCYWQFYLAFSPNKSLTYEIVFLWRNSYDDHQMAVYSSETSSWRLCGYIEFKHKLIGYQCVIWNNGGLNGIDFNWIDGRTLYYYNIAQQVLHKTSELCDEMQKHPQEPEEYFGECMGHMHLILIDKASWCLGVFEMEIDYSGWKSICRVDISGLAYQYNIEKVYGLQPIKNKKVYGLHILKVVVKGEGDEDELKAFIFLHDKAKFVSCDLKKNSLKEICDNQMGWYVQHPQPSFIGSLANV